MAAISKTVLKVKPGEIQEVIEQLNSASHSAAGIAGLNGFGFDVTGDNEITAFGVYDGIEANQAWAPFGISSLF